MSKIQNYEGNLEIAKEWFEVFVTEDFDALTEFYADEVEFQSAFYGGPIMDREETLNYLKGWQDAMEDITWEAENYLPGVILKQDYLMVVLECMDIGLEQTQHLVKVLELMVPLFNI